ncbi:MAG: DUF1998 domain-containing protein [Anaerolineae bacterium]|nr:DUF1998 domain-containing protein [Anaerolineae bacterium]
MMSESAMYSGAVQAAATEAPLDLGRIPRHVAQQWIDGLNMALKRAVEALYQLEDGELAAEPLPGEDAPRLILFYEAAEGGAGVLRRLVETPDALRRVAIEALRICHYDPETGADLGGAPGAPERCEAACYECLLSYSNQRVHDQLDRHKAAAWLRANLLDGVVCAGPTAAPRGEHVQRLSNLCESDLEREWLAYLDARNLRLPDDAQVYVEHCQTRADFVYRDKDTVVYIDGPHHDDAHQQAEDARITRCLRDLGVTVLRFGYRRATWDAIIEGSKHIFGGEV